MSQKTESKVTRHLIAGAVAAAAVGVGSIAHADVDLAQGLKIKGFADMSVYNLKPQGGPSVSSAAIDRVKTTLMFSLPKDISADVGIQYGEKFGGGGTGTYIQQATVSKAFTEQFKVKFGRFLSYSGWETEEPTGLFQSTGSGYAPLFYGYYQNGVSGSYNSDKFDLMGSVVTSAFDPLDSDAKKLGYEVGAAIKPVKGLVGKVFYIKDNDSDTDIVNAWASYSASGFTFAGEYNTANYAAGAKGDGFLVMGNYATGPWSFTLRYVDYSTKNGRGVKTLKTNSITVSPSYKVSDNLLLITEYRKDTVKVGGTDSDRVTLEALFSF